MTWWMRDALLKAVACPAQRYSAIGVPGISINQGCSAIRRRRLALTHNNGSTRAIFRECLDRQRHRYKPAIAKLADAANGVAGHAVAETWIFRCACIRVGGEPLLDRKTVAAAVNDRKSSIGSANDGCLTVTGNQRIRPRGRNRPKASGDQKDCSAPAQRSAEKTDKQKAGRTDQQRTSSESLYAPHSARQVVHPQRHPDHPIDAVAHQLPEHRV